MIMPLTLSLVTIQTVTIFIRYRAFHSLDLPEFSPLGSMVTRDGALPLI